MQSEILNNIHNTKIVNEETINSLEVLSQSIIFGQ